MSPFLSFLAAAFLIPTQDVPSEETVRRWIASLDSKSIPERIAARDRIVHSAAEAALPLLGKRHADIRAEIEQNRGPADFYGPPKFVTIDAPDEAVINVLTEIENQTGEDLDLRRIDPGKNVSIKIDHRTLWYALDAVCRAAEIDFRAPYSGRLQLVPGIPPKSPRFEYGPFLVRLTSVRIDRIIRHGRPGEEMTLAFEIIWPNHVKPGGPAGKAFLERVRDSAGKSLLLEGGNDALNVSSKSGPKARYRRYTVSGLLVPSGDVPRISEISGSLDVPFPTALETVEIEIPHPPEGNAAAGKSFSVKLKAYTSRQDNRFIADLEITAEDGAPGAEEISVIFLTNRDHEFRARLSNVKKEGRTLSFTAQAHNIRRGMEVDRIKVTAPTGIIMKKVPFHFSDIELKR